MPILSLIFLPIALIADSLDGYWTYYDVYDRASMGGI